MRNWSIPLGRIFGVDLRMHATLLLLLAVAISYTSVTEGNGARGAALWLLLLLAIAVREVARALSAAWYSLDVRSLVLLPTGGLTTCTSPESHELASRPESERRMVLVGPVVSLCFGLLLGSLLLVLSPGLDLFERPWITPAHLLRSSVWINLFLGALNFLPAAPLDGGRIFRAEFSKSQGLVKGSRTAAGLGQFVSLGLIMAGMLLPNTWLLLLGIFMLVGARMEDRGLMLQNDVNAVRMRDIMLMDFSTLSASDTLEDALQRSLHTLQDVFPVVRGSSLVGAVSRQNIIEALQSNGNGYIQGVMTRFVETAQPDDSLVKTLRRIMGGRGAQLVPVIEGDRVVGIITPQNLAHSMSLLNQRRRLRGRNHAD